MKVLYVEDNPANVFLIKRVARMGNHEIINYIDGDVALKKFDEIQPDLVLMDIQLAGNKSGLDVVKQLRARGVETPIIAVTAYAMVGDKERCLDAGCDDYLAKPLPVQRVVKIFQHYSDFVEQKATAVVDDSIRTSNDTDATIDVADDEKTPEPTVVPAVEDVLSDSSAEAEIDTDIPKDATPKVSAEVDIDSDSIDTVAETSSETIDTSNQENELQLVSDHHTVESPSIANDTDPLASAKEDVS